jgi:hypothetical protein
MSMVGGQNESNGPHLNTLTSCSSLVRLGKWKTYLCSPAVRPLPGASLLTLESVSTMLEEATSQFLSSTEGVRGEERAKGGEEEEERPWERDA